MTGRCLNGWVCDPPRQLRNVTRDASTVVEAMTIGLRQYFA